MALVAPLVGRQVEERRSRLVARRAHPVERERERLPARQRAHLLLADVVRPAAAVRPPRSRTASPATGTSGRSGRSGTSGWCRRPSRSSSGPRSARRCGRTRARPGRRAGRSTAGDRLLPGGRVGRRVVVVRRATRPGSPARPTPYWASSQVEHRGHELAADPQRRDAAAHRRCRPRPRRRRSAADRRRRVSPPRSSSVSSGSMPSSRRFQRPSSPRRSGARPSRWARPARRCARRSRPSSTRRSPRRRRPRSEARRNRSGTYASSRSRSVTSSGRSVNRRA